MGRHRKQEPIGEDYVEFGDRLKALREARNMTQAELSQHIGISKTSVVNYETGTRKIPISLVKQVAGFFDVSVDYMLGFTTKRVSEYERAVERWDKEVGTHRFTEGELNELISFANYLLFKRGEHR